MTITVRSLGSVAALVLAACSAPVPATPGETLDGNAASYTLGASDRPRTPIEVTVLAADGAPVAGARVVVSGRYAAVGMCCVGAEKVAEGATDAAGVCALDARLSSAVGGVRAAACAGDLVGISAWAEDPGEKRTALTVRVVPGTRPRGVVLDTSGAPVPRAAVASWYGGGNLRVFRGATVAGADGTFVLPALPRAAIDDLFVEASAPDVGSGGVTPKADDPLDALRVVLTYPPPPGGGGPK